MKEKIEQFILLNEEIKNRCYHLCNKWSDYRKSLVPPISDTETGIYDYKDYDLSKLDFSFDESFAIGFEYTDRCGETEKFITYLSLEMLVDENLIKQYIDEEHQMKLAEIEKKRLKEEEKEAKTREREYQEYLRLQKKFKTGNVI